MGSSVEIPHAGTERDFPFLRAALNHQEVIFILSCFLSLLVLHLFFSSQVHVLIIHIATGVCIRVSTVKYKRVPGRLPRQPADDDFS